jgi:hypothetical protein
MAHTRCIFPVLCISHCQISATYTAEVVPTHFFASFGRKKLVILLIDVVLTFFRD